jgi:beta-RFAP synthase
MFRVAAPSRLHFGLIHPAPVAPPARRFGGVGLMVDRPGVSLRVEPAATWSAEGPAAERALRFARRLAEALGDAEAPQRILVDAAPPEHVGLGVGTQLALAVGRALAAAWGRELDAPTLAKLLGRGARSAIGVHGFDRGGLLVDGGKARGDELAPLVAHVCFPPQWRIVVAIPDAQAGLHGDREAAAFADLPPEAADARRTDALCRLVVLGLLPAAAVGDLEAFGESLHEFNARAGEAFAAAQGGRYAGPAVMGCMDFFRGLGAKGVGQSSWGPAVFAVVGDADRGDDLVGRAATEFGLAPSRVWSTAAASGAQLEPV